MRVSEYNDKVIIYLNKYFLKDLDYSNKEEVLKLLLSLKKRININLEGVYDVKVYHDKENMIMELYYLDEIELDYPSFNIEIYNKNTIGSILAFNVKDIFSQDTAIYLDKYNICIRAGNHCAKMINNVFTVNNTCRISLSFYNTEKEIDELIKALKNINNIYNEII